MVRVSEAGTECRERERERERERRQPEETGLALAQPLASPE